ncbi:MAG: CinA family protein [Acidipropionibacterium sp.]|nr:CinA family protein [Acidipropionibacterium sp.]
MSPDPLAARLIGALIDGGLTAATCESLTGGLVGATLTGVPGASAAYRGGLVTYASDLKASLAGVDAEWIASHGVINAETAQMMAQGCARACSASIGLACTGVAGPEPQDGEPVGTVYVCAWASWGAVPARLALSGGRQEIRRQTVRSLLEAGLELVRARS